MNRPRPVIRIRYQTATSQPPDPGLFRPVRPYRALMPASPSRGPAHRSRELPKDDVRHRYADEKEHRPDEVPHPPMEPGQRRPKVQDDDSQPVEGVVQH